MSGLTYLLCNKPQELFTFPAHRLKEREGKVCLTGDINNATEKVEKEKVNNAILTEADAKTANALLSSHSCSCLSRVFAFVRSASLAVGVVISSKATSFCFSIDSFFRACSPSSFSSSSCQDRTDLNTIIFFLILSLYFYYRKPIQE